MKALIASCLSLLVGLIAGAAIQRWGDGVKASGHLGTETVMSIDDLWSAWQ